MRSPAQLHGRLPLTAGMRVGLLGGSFDPPHEGHLHVARTALLRLQLDRVVWLVSPGNPLKASRGDDLPRRIAATEALADGPRMVVSGVESALGTRFTLDTVRALKRRHPGVSFVWIMGADNLAQFHRWRDWQGIFEEIPIAVVARPGFGLSARTSPAARRFDFARLPERSAPLLAGRDPPAWVYLQARWSFASSTALRSRLRGAGD